MQCFWQRQLFLAENDMYKKINEKSTNFPFVRYLTNKRLFMMERNPSKIYWESKGFSCEIIKKIQNTLTFGKKETPKRH